ncbi:30S ribosomal protein S15 [Monoraphidium neglectum]|uniref:30S ribosomal protein S15 n=1 Tax=Monoraphidium neglectum TaxID=145388 RepID=A0A0D2KKI5_9CHLO|nr:30S ribosomal protein S15 [Monoraphidium neglectum]KIY96323.1 30S ribosomal protein S15 [Monoraphidium neglectum]|eukprot:XP_013895343.1 30S ribosomal protein S15 [Monoraphidium neglectum]
MASLCGHRAGVFGSAVRGAPRVERARLVISASFKNKENIDLEKVPAYKQHDSDSGSTQVQIARLSARITQIGDHMKANRKDFSSKRGLEAVLSQRKRLLRYLYRTDRAAYDKLIGELGIRSVIAGDSHKAAQRVAAAAAAK